MPWTEEPPLTQPFAALEAAVRGVLSVQASRFSRTTAQDAVTAFLRVRHQADAAYLHLLRVLSDQGASSCDVARFLSCAPDHLSPAQADRDVEAAKVTAPSVVWDGRIGGVDGDRGALQHLGDTVGTSNRSRGSATPTPTTAARPGTSACAGAPETRDCTTGAAVAAGADAS